MELVRPRPPRADDTVRVVAPARSLAIIPAAERALAVSRLEALGLRVRFGKHVESVDGHDGCATIEQRVEDLHEAFADPGVAAILTVIGGHDSNQLLPYLGFELVRANPTVFCGYSGITALSGAFPARAGLVTFSGTHVSTSGMRDHVERTITSFRRALFDGVPVRWEPSPEWTDDEWYLDQDHRVVEHTDGWWILQPGTAEGALVGGNQSGMDRQTLAGIVASKRELTGLPVLANVDFGHASPMYTFPVGGRCTVSAHPGQAPQLTVGLD
jgi:muramoyltetrapeptide carboxypeptidase LdcA involved in peptidoglycan recycling